MANQGEQRGADRGFQKHSRWRNIEYFARVVRSRTHVPSVENGDTFVDVRRTNSQNGLSTHFVDVVLFQLTETSVVRRWSVAYTVTKTMFEFHIVK